MAGKNKLPPLDFGHLYRYEELTGRNALSLDPGSIRDIADLLYVLADEPEGGAKTYIAGLGLDDLKQLIPELQAALKRAFKRSSDAVPLASTPQDPPG